MLLCDVGFIKAADLMNGMNVIRCVRGEGKVSADPNDDWEPSFANKVFDSLLVSGGVLLGSVPVAPEDLHGDAALSNGEVDIVNATSLLSGDFKSKCSKHAAEVDLVLRLLAEGFNGLSPGDQLLRGCFASSGSDISSPRELLALFTGHAIHADRVCDRFATEYDASTNERTLDRISRYRKVFCDLEDALPSVVSFDEVVNVEFDFLHDFATVYDFQTERSLYLISNGIVSSNCQCWIEHVAV